MKGNLKCPRCGSDGIQKARILYEAGTSSIKMTSSGIGVTGGGCVGVGVATATGGTQTELSKKLSPPTKPQRSTGLTLGVFALTISGICYTIGALVGGRIVHSLFGIGCMSVGFFLIKSLEESLKKARAQYQVDYANWGRLWFCNRCGDTFYVEQVDESPGVISNPFTIPSCNSLLPNFGQRHIFLLQIANGREPNK